MYASVFGLSGVKTYSFRVWRPLVGLPVIRQEGYNFPQRTHVISNHIVVISYVIITCYVIVIFGSIT